jgi:hypothetical protein
VSVTVTAVCMSMLGHACQCLYACVSLHVRCMRHTAVHVCL